MSRTMRKRIRRIVLAALGAAVLAPASGASAAGQWDQLLAPESACPNQSDRSLPAAVQIQAMLCLHQFARAQAGVTQLHPMKKLRVSSARKARDIRRCQDFSHGACGRDPFYWQKRVGFMKGSFGAGENLALGSGAGGTVRSLMTGLLNSDGHRSVLLNPTFDRIGIGTVTGKFRGFAGVSIWVVHLGYQH